MRSDLNSTLKTTIHTLGVLLAFGFSDVSAEPCGPHLPKGAVCEGEISALHPTQPEVGFDEIKDKVGRYSGYSDSKLERLVEKKDAPIIIGPDGNFYLRDHHHSLLALQDEKVGITNAKLHIDENWFRLGEGLPMAERMQMFWDKMQAERIGWYELEDGTKFNPMSDAFPKRLKDCKNNRMRAVIYRLYKAGVLKRPKPAITHFEFHVSKALREAGYKVNDDEVKEAVKIIEKFLKKSAGKKLVEAVRCKFITSRSSRETLDSLD